MVGLKQASHCFDIGLAQLSSGQEATQILDVFSANPEVQWVSQVWVVFSPNFPSWHFATHIRLGSTSPHELLGQVAMQILEVFWAKLPEGHNKTQIRLIFSAKPVVHPPSQVQVEFSPKRPTLHLAAQI